MKSKKGSSNQEEKQFLNLHKWLDLLKLFKDKNLIELIFENESETRINFYESLFYILDSIEDFRELMDNPNDEEISENPFNQFYGICNAKPSQVKMNNPSTLHLNKTNTDAIFCFLINSMWELNREDGGKIDRLKLKDENRKNILKKKSGHIMNNMYKMMQSVLEILKKIIKKKENL